MDEKHKTTHTTEYYLAIFLYITVKTVHIEIVSELSTNAFITVPYRFMSRRGIPLNVYTDYSTNFKMHFLNLKEMYTLCNRIEAILNS